MHRLRGADPVNCVLCLHGLGISENGTQVIDGTSLCPSHGYAVVSRHPGIYFDPHDRLHVMATIKALKETKSEGR